MDPTPPKKGRLQLVALTLLLVGALAAATTGWRRAFSSQAELAQLRQQMIDLQAAATRSANALRQVEAMQGEIDRLQRENREIHRLRGQYQEWQQLKADYEKLQGENAALEQAKNSMAQSLQAAAQKEPPQPREAWIGVTLDPEFQGGAKVRSVVPGSPAATSGLEDDDVITSVDGQPVRSSEELRNTIAERTAGQAVRIDLQRGGQVRRVILRTAPFPR